MEDSTEESLKHLEQFYGFKPLSENKMKDIIYEKYPKVKIIYDKLKDIIIPEIKNKANIDAYIIPRPVSNSGIRWSDYPGSYMKEFHNIDECDMSIIFNLNNDGEIDVKSNIQIQYTEFNLQEKKEILDIFQRELPFNFCWNGRNTRKMYIFYEEDDEENDVKIEDLKENDFYPQLYINISNINNVELCKEIIENILNLVPENIDKDYGYDGVGKDLDMIIYSIEDIKDDINNYIDSNHPDNSFRVQYRYRVNDEESDRNDDREDSDYDDDIELEDILKKYSESLIKEN